MSEPNVTPNSGSSPEEAQNVKIQETLEAAKAAAARAQADAAAWREQAARAMQAMTSNVAVRQPDPEPEEAEEDVDPAVLKALEKRLSKFEKTLGEVYVRDRQADQERWYRNEFEKAKALPKFGELAQDVDSYLQSVPVHLRATPGAVEEAYYVALGRRTRAELERQESRGEPLSATGSRPSAVPTGPTFDSEAKDFLKRTFGEDFSDEELAVLDNKVMSFDDYKKRVTK